MNTASGANISEFETLYATAASAKKISDDIAAGFAALADFPMPTIAMIRGACVGGGCGLALCCDIRFADHTSKYAITPAKLGLVYPFSDVQRLIETVGIPNAKDMLFSARLIQSKVARKMGIINQLFKVDDLEEKTIDYAQGRRLSIRTIPRNSPIHGLVLRRVFKRRFQGRLQSFFGKTKTSFWIKFIGANP